MLIRHFRVVHVIEHNEDVVCINASNQGGTTLISVPLVNFMFTKGTFFMEKGVTNEFTRRFKNITSAGFTSY